MLHIMFTLLQHRLEIIIAFYTIFYIFYIILTLNIYHSFPPGKVSISGCFWLNLLTVFKSAVKCYIYLVYQFILEYETKPSYVLDGSL